MRTVILAIVIGFLGGAVATGSEQNQPAPFLTTTLRLDFPQSIVAHVAIVDASGRHIRQLWDGTLPSGRIHFGWDGRDESGSHVPAGQYRVRVNGATVGTLRHQS